VKPVESRPAAADAHLTLARIERGLRMVTVPFPHLAGLVAAARVTLDERLPTMGVFASGRLVANPRFVARLKDPDLVFVLAHEMLHLALRTHDRMRGADRTMFNYAHDYIINDMLRAELGVRTIPANGLDMAGARDKSAEEILLDMRRDAAHTPSRTRVWDGEAVSAGQRFPSPGRTPRGQKGREAGAGDPARSNDPGDGGDVLADELEREWYPGDADQAKREAERIRALAAKALALAEAMGALRGIRGLAPGSSKQTVTALQGLYKTPWQLALQRWIESVSPGERTFTRPSRRTAPRSDVVLPGRRRQGWLLTVVLDTSASMSDEIPRALGAIAHYCDAAGVDQVRLVQCDAEVTADDFVAPEALAEREIAGYGGSDLSPALHYLADDERTRATIVITDGDIQFPPEAMPYDVLWVLPANTWATFAPSYGRVVRME
jgi:predicted metal-dependent peptidase